MKGSATPAPWEVKEFGSSSCKGVGGIEAMLEVDSVFNSVLPMVEVDCVSKSVFPAVAEAAEAPSSSEVEQVDSRSRLEVDPVSRGASPASLI